MEFFYVEDVLYWGAQIQADSVILPTLHYKELVGGNCPPAARAQIKNQVSPVRPSEVIRRTHRAFF